MYPQDRKRRERLERKLAVPKHTFDTHGLVVAVHEESTAVAEAVRQAFTSHKDTLLLAAGGAAAVTSAAPPAKRPRVRGFDDVTSTSSSSSPSLSSSSSLSSSGEDDAPLKGVSPGEASSAVAPAINQVEKETTSIGGDATAAGDAEVPAATSGVTADVSKAAPAKNGPCSGVRCYIFGQRSFKPCVLLQWWFPSGLICRRLQLPPKFCNR